MHRVQECGQIAASKLALGSGDEPDDGFHEDSMLLDRQAALPIHPDTQIVSSAHLQAVRATRRYGFLPLSVAEQARWDRRATEAFDQAPCFWDALIHLADSLFEVPVAKRKTVLRHELKVLECEVLPNNAVYVPLHHVPHRVWRLVADESIPLGTKERVPCIVILEVVQMTDHDVAFHSTSLPVDSNSNGNGPYRRRRSSWATLLGRLPQKLGGPGQGGSEDLAEDEDVELDEMDLVHEWQHKYREPLRRLPFISKVADSMKGGLSRVRSTVRERLERDRTVSDELQALTLAESLVSSESMPLEIDQTPTSTPVKENTESPSTGLSRANSGNSLESMGQWGTPQPSKPTVSARIDLSGVRRRMDRESRPESPTGGLVYGSDHDEEKGFDSILVPSLARKEEELPTPKKGSEKEKSRPPPVVFRESWQAKQERVRRTSAYGQHPGWKLLPVLIKANDDLRQEQMAAQLIYKMASILARENCPVWLCPYEILALTDRGGIIEAIPDTISLDSLKRNDSGFTSLRDFFHSYYGEDTSALASAKANFVESLAAYSMVCFLLQIKDRHNGNILLDSRGHMIHIDFGFFFLSSPGKNAGFESAPFKLTREFVEVLDGTQSHLFHVFRELCVRSFLALRKHCMEIILLVEMLKTGNEELQCFRGAPDEAVRQLRQRFRLDLNDRACREYVHSLIDASTENWRTDWYDRYQRYFVGVL
jgi:phosphatidylinositol 4-kinase